MSAVAAGNLLYRLPKRSGRKMPFPRSLAITSGISVDVFSLSYLDVSVRSVTRIFITILWFINRVYPEGNPQIKRGIVLFSVVNLRNIDYLTWLFVFVNVLFSKCLGLRFLSLCLNFTCCPLFGLISGTGHHNVKLKVAPACGTYPLTCLWTVTFRVGTNSPKR